MMRKNFRKLLHIVLSVCLFISLIPSLIIQASALTISGVDGNVTYTKSGSPVLIDSNMAFDGAVSGTFIEINPTQGFTSGDALAIISDGDPNASGAISIYGDTVYQGTGSGKKAVATVDSYYDGTNGKALRFNFEASFVNGDFSQSINTGWTPTNALYPMSGDTPSSISTNIGISGGMVMMTISGSVTTGYGTAHGPSITSDTFQANAGDAVSVYLQAIKGSDQYDVYGYLKNTSSGALTQLFYKRGDSYAGTVSGTIPSTGTWQFLFICGTYDKTGGRAVGSTMYIDNVTLESAQLDQTLANSIIQHVGFSTTTGTVTSSVRQWNVRYGTTTSPSTSSGTGTINLKLAPPTSAAFNAGINTIGMSYSASGAQSYDIYNVDLGTTAYGQSSSYTDSGLTPNTLYRYQIKSKNAGVDLDSDYSAVFSEYTLAAVPGITVENQAYEHGKNDWTIAANGNPAGTTYRVLYSTDNANWGTAYQGTATTGTHSGLSEDTRYYYKAYAVNGDNIASSYSGTVTAKTNDCPVITGLSPTLDIYRSEVTGHTTVTLSGTVTDHDNDTVTVTATANGAERSTAVSATEWGASWSLSWDVINDAFAEATFTGIGITANDGTGKDNAGSSVTWAKTLYVDKTPPASPAVTNNTAWTNAASVTVTMTNGADTGDVVTGADYTKYRYRTVDADDTSIVLSDWTSWTTYTGAFNITAAGITTIEAVTVDKAGNESTAAASVVKIDRTDPVGGSFTLKATYEDLYDNITYTRGQTVNLTEISASESGGDQLETAPTTMEISNSADFTVSSGWVTYGSEYNGWVLTPGDGEKTVYIRFKDSVGNVSAAITDTIIYDGTAPVIAISAPSRYAAKCGLSVSYTLTVDDAAAALHGINAVDASYVTLSATGTVEAKAEVMPDWISIEDIDGTHRRVTITLPADLVEEGTIAITVSTAAAIDPAGNESEAVPGNFSFNVDSTPPTHQDALFTADLTIAGGGAVTLAIPSSDCEGGQDGDSVRFAPVGYDGTAPANGATITSTHGKSATIIAPTTEGTYKLYIIDEAGNISEASSATLTVKNLGPAITIEGPSAQYVQAADSVEYIVTYSADTANITLGQMDVTLETTGTANAYVSVSEIAGEPLQRKITLSNLMGEGTVAVRIAEGSATDDIGNPAASYMSATAVTVDNTAPVVTSVSVSASNADPAYAKEGDTITVTLGTNEVIAPPEVLINGRGTTVISDPEGTGWAAGYTIPAGTMMTEGAVTISIVATDRAGNTAGSVTATTDASSVTTDFTAPEITLTGDMDASQTYYTGDITVTFDSGTAELENLTTGAVTGIVSGGVVNTAGSYELTVTDAAGNAAQETFILSQDYFDVMSDREALEIIYAAGDSAGSVTRDVTLPTSGGAGSSISWEVTSGTAVAVDESGDPDAGIVTRPASGTPDASVVLKATIEKSGFSTTKTFNLTVLAQSGDTPEEKAEDDAASAVIRYAEGDSQVSVTQDIGLSGTGALHGSEMSWSCESPYVTISETAEEGYYAVSVTRPAYEDGDAAVTLTVTAALTEGTGEGAVTGTSEQTVTITIKKQDGSSALKAETDADAAYITYQGEDSAEAVRQDITLVFTGAEGSAGVWSSSDTDVIAVAGDTGAVARPSEEDGNAAVTITLTVTNGEAETTRTFELTVVAQSESPEQDEADVQNDADALAIIYRGADTKDSVTTHLILPVTGDNGSTVTWTSSNAAVSGNGTVTRSAAGDVVVTLTATVTKGEAAATRAFTVKVIKMPLTLLEQLGADADALIIEYLEGDSADSVTGALTLMSAGANGCTITWMSDNPAVITADGSVTRPAETVQVTITAAVEKEGFIIYREFTLTVTAP